MGWCSEEQGVPAAAVSTEHAVAPLALADQPSIAVLPFVNMSGDPAQDYFADGMTEEIITALARFESLFVIARNSSFAYRGQTTDIERIARELGVRYVFQGSVRNSGDRVRITGQLIVAETGTHIWANRFERRIGDIFDLQDEITESIVSGRSSPKSSRRRCAARAAKPDSLLAAYDCVLRAYQHLFNLTLEDNDKALTFCNGRSGWSRIRSGLRVCELGQPVSRAAHSGWIATALAHGRPNTRTESGRA